MNSAQNKKKKEKDVEDDWEKAFSEEEHIESNSLSSDNSRKSNSSSSRSQSPSSSSSEEERQNPVESNSRPVPATQNTTGARKESGSSQIEIIFPRKEGQEVHEKKEEPVVQKSSNAWRPQKRATEKEKTIRSLNGLLNKLTVEKFNAISEQIRQILPLQIEIIRDFISMVFDKATTQKHFVEMYSDLCYVLSSALPTIDEFDGVEYKELSFQDLLRDKCQDEFHKESTKLHQSKDHVVVDPSKSTEDQISEAESSQKRLFGISLFVAELCKKEVLKKGISHLCVKNILFERKVPIVEAEIEVVCKLLGSIGQKMEEDNVDRMDKYFACLKGYLTGNFSSRIKFMIEDLIAQRANRWKARKAVEKAKSLQAIREEVAQQTPDGKKNRNAQPKRPEAPPAKVMLPTNGAKNLAGSRVQGGPPGSVEEFKPDYASLSQGAIGWNGQPQSRPQQPQGHPQNPKQAQQKGAQAGKEQDKKGQQNTGKQPYQGQQQQQQQQSYQQSQKNVQDLDTSKQAKKKEAPALLDEKLMKEKFEAFLRKQVKIDQFSENLDQYLIPPSFILTGIQVGISINVNDGGQMLLLSELFTNLLKKKKLTKESVTKAALEAIRTNVSAFEKDPTIAKKIAYLIFHCDTCAQSFITNEFYSFPSLKEATEEGLLSSVISNWLCIDFADTESHARSLYKKLDFSYVLPQNQQSIRALYSFLEKNNILALDEELSVFSDVGDKLNSGISLVGLGKWCEKNISSEITPKLINCLVGACVEHLLDTGKNDVDKVVQKFARVLNPILTKSIENQLIALNQIQQRFSEVGTEADSVFPGKLLLKFFLALYDTETITEEAYLSWKENDKDSFGKQQCLSALVKFYTWLATASEESESEGSGSE